jgi:hypothetical protein
VQADQIEQLRNYTERRNALLDDPFHIQESQRILFLDQTDWVIRAAVMRNDLSARDVDYLEKRLQANLENLIHEQYATLDEALRATKLLAVIGRPIDRQLYRDRVHDLLRKFHIAERGGFDGPGGFVAYAYSSWPSFGDMPATASAVELMETYGPPSGLDLISMRSFLRPNSVRRPEDQMIAAVSMNRLNHLPGAEPTWLDYLYYERSMVMAVLLVLLCIYATYSSPRANPFATAAPSAGHD